MTPLTPEAKVQLKQTLSAGITDSALLAVVMSRLDGILRDVPPNWDDANDWTVFTGTANDPSGGRLARFHADLACNDVDGTIANRMAARATEFAPEDLPDGYAKVFARALLDKSCKGGQALTKEGRASLKALIAAPE
jgi:hypothetical protein